jgi:hypothetical protein
MTTATETDEKVEADNLSLKKFFADHVDVLAAQWPSLRFAGTGQQRLGHCAGFFRGLCAAGKADLATYMAADLDRHLTNLNDYGGMTPVIEKSVPPDLEVPAYRVMLHDDGTFGGFGLAWYRYVSNESLLRKVAAETLTGEDNYAAYQRIRRENNFREELEIQRGYYPTWDTEKKFWSSALCHYAYSFNGGLLYHGPGGDETFSVVIGDCRYWSIHT